ncbi:MAG: KOW motif-containing protein, partial [Muribaculaceae bacterium]|nr:KOW motif-containing protein [Muribaculaceae bacterium]
MNEQYTEEAEWFAIKTRQDFKAEEQLAPLCEEILFPKETVKLPGKKSKQRAIIPHVLFIKTTKQNAIALEQQGREHPELSVPFWIYRFPKSKQIQVIPESSIILLRLLTADDTTKCEIYNKMDFKENQYVQITSGPFAGYKGHVVRVKKNKHVVVRIEGICALLLPFI